MTYPKYIVKQAKGMTWKWCVIRVDDDDHSSLVHTCQTREAAREYARRMNDPAQPVYQILDSE